MSVKREPILLTLPAGIPEVVATRIREQLKEAAKLTDWNFILLDHGMERATQRVVHEFGPGVDDALIALPRIADALERIADQLREDHLSRHGRPGTGPR